MDIYQAIWDADQEGNGVEPILHEDQGNESRGYVVVNELAGRQPDHKLFTDVVIPNTKMSTYALCKKLFNNFTLDQTKDEAFTPEELAETHELLESIVETKPMRVAKAWAERQTGTSYTFHRWYEMLKEIWFTPYDDGQNRDLTGFEHVVVGEQKGSKAGGYHFWYKYYLDDSFHLTGEDNIIYHGSKGGNQQENKLVPEVSTISYQWNAFDYQEGAFRPLFKKIGGFYNGCSIEGLLALGTIRMLPQFRAPKEATINGSLYSLRIYRSPNDRHLRTFYPEFVRITGTVDTDGDGSDDDELITINTVPNTIKIIGALINPEGHDPGKETVTIVNTTAKTVTIKDWHIEDKNGNQYALKADELGAGEFLTVTLEENTAQLSNKGGIIRLLDQDEKEIHSTSYTGGQAKEQGKTILF